MSLFTIDKISLNISFAESRIFSSWNEEMGRWAKIELASSLNGVFEKFNEVIESSSVSIDCLDLDLGSVDPERFSEEILQRLKNALLSALKEELLKRMTLPTIKTISEVYHSFLSQFNASEFEEKCFRYIGEQASSWKDPQKLAKIIILNMREEYPFLDARQIACLVYKKIEELQKCPMKKIGIEKAVITVPDAGLVLLGPYIPRLFEILKYVENKIFVDERCRMRAAAILKFLVFENYKDDQVEPSLAKYLCGVPLNRKIPDQAILNESEKAIANDLLSNVCVTWSVLKNTSLAGLRSSFLHRKGTLTEKDNDCYLQVETLAFDLLLDKLPWGFATLKMPWQKGILFTKWR